MKSIVTPRQMRLIEETAFENGIDQLDLMEKAAQCVADELEEMTGFRGKRAVFFCGKGNNGGDGLAAGARTDSRHAGGDGGNHASVNRA